MVPFNSSSVTRMLVGDFKLIESFERRRGERPSAFERKRGERGSVRTKHGCSNSRQSRKTPKRKKERSFPKGDCEEGVSTGVEVRWESQACMSSFSGPYRPLA